MKAILKLTKANDPSTGNPVYVNVDKICYMYSNTVGKKPATYVMFEEFGIYVEESVEDILDLIVTNIYNSLVVASKEQEELIRQEKEKEFLDELNKEIDKSVIDELRICKSIDEYILKKMIESKEADIKKQKELEVPKEAE